MSGDLPRVAEEEDKRLLMPASGGCFRLVVDVERLSAESGEEEQTREEGFTRGQPIGKGLQVQTRDYEALLLANSFKRK